MLYPFCSFIPNKREKSYKPLGGYWGLPQTSLVGEYMGYLPRFYILEINLHPLQNQGDSNRLASLTPSWIPEYGVVTSSQGCRPRETRHPARHATVQIDRKWPRADNKSRKINLLSEGNWEPGLGDLLRESPISLQNQLKWRGSWAGGGAWGLVKG